MTKPLTSLTQRHRLSRREFVLLEDGLEVRETGPFAASDYRVSFESLGDREYRVANASRSLFGFAVGATLVALLVQVALPPSIVSRPLALVATVAALLLWAAFGLSRRSWVVLPGSEMDVVFFADHPTAEALQGFLEDVHAQRRSALDERRRQEQGGDQTLSMVDDLERISWLGEQGFLTEDEIEALKERLTGVTSPGRDGGGEPVN